MIATAVHSKVTQFIDDVCEGRIVVGKLIGLAVRRHVNDIERAETAGFPYRFDAIAASASCEFFPLVMRHTIGDHAGLPFELEPWQAFFCWSLFGWKRTSDGSRRFRKFFMSVARKNGKSTFAAGIAIMLASCDFNPITGTAEQVAEVILCATKKEQAEKVIYAEIDRMRTNSVWLTKKSSRINKQISFSENQGSIRCVGSDKPYDGLNPHAIIMDELHAWKEYHRKFYDTMQTGSGARRQPVIGTVTTAGDDLSHLWLEEHKYAAGILDGSIVDESFLAYPWEIDEDDNALDEANWAKANPNLGVSVKIDYIREQARQAATSNISLNRFTRYHCNRRVSSTEKAFNVEAWDACKRILSDWNRADAIGCGIDLGSRDDLAASAMCARFVIAEREGKPVYRYELQTFAYVSEESARDLTKAPYCDWVFNGFLKKSRYPIADLRDELIENCSRLHAGMVAYDPYNAQQIAEELKQEGLEPFRMAQNQSMFNEPIRDLMAAMEEVRLAHDGNPVLRWCVNNAVLHRDRTDKWMYDKASSSEKIDVIVAATMAFRVASVIPARASGKLFIT